MSLGQSWFRAVAPLRPSLLVGNLLGLVRHRIGVPPSVARPHHRGGAPARTGVRRVRPGRTRRFAERAVMVTDWRCCWRSSTKRHAQGRAAVNLSRGHIVWYRHSPGPSAAGATPATDGERVSAEQAIAIVKRSRHTGLDEDERHDLDHAEANGEAAHGVRAKASLGDPPERSEPGCVRPRQRVGPRRVLPPAPSSEAPAEVVITEPQATEVALAHAVESASPSTTCTSSMSGSCRGALAPTGTSM